MYKMRSSGKSILLKIEVKNLKPELLEVLLLYWSLLFLIIISTNYLT